jgi:adenylate cyclase
MEYTALGETVNTASRLERLTRRLNRPIIIGANTISKELELMIDEGQPVNLRGMSMPVRVFAVNV